MPLYDFICHKCNIIIEINKSMNSDNPPCPQCNGEIERYYCPENIPTVGYGNRPIYTYDMVKKYKTFVHEGKEYKVDPNKHGDIGAMNVDLGKGKPKRTKK